MRAYILLLMAAVLAAVASSAPARAEVRKFVTICGRNEQGVRLCPSFALMLTPPEGWVEDAAASKQNGVQMLVPRGQTFGSAETAIYVKVSYRTDKNQPLSDFVRTSQERWRKAVPDTTIAALPEQLRDNGKPAFLLFRYENPSRPQQAHEIVAFGLDADKDGNEYVLMIVATTGAKKFLERADGPYKAFLRAH